MSSPSLDLNFPAQRLRAWLGTPRGAMAAMFALLCALLVPLPDLPDWVAPFFNITHVVLFAFVGWVLRRHLAAISRMEDRYANLATLALGALIGAAGEIAQRFIPGRDASFGDEWLDLVGLIAGLTLYRLSWRSRFEGVALGHTLTQARNTLDEGALPAPDDGRPKHAGVVWLSVIVPTYNRCAAVQRAVDSVLAQGEALALEVIVVDDGSTDATATALAQRYAAEPRVRYVHSANAGASAARNRGLALARGEVVLFLDSDDWLLPGALALVARAFALQASLRFVFIEGRTEARPGHPQRLHIARGECPGWQHGDFTQSAAFHRHGIALAGGSGEVTATLTVGDFFPAVMRGGLFFLSGLFMRREAALGAGRFVERYRLWEDWDFYARVCEQGCGGYLDAIGFCRDTGRGDQLSDAVNGLRFAAMHCRIARRLCADPRTRDGRTRARLRNACADAHYWLGRCLIQTRHRRLGRHLLLASLQRLHKPARSTAWLLRSLLP
jgi:glycosyltransferase involved in cell wall biosynthesis/VanZ family protein